jgi:hypothetical protein
VSALAPRLAALGIDSYRLSAGGARVYGAARALWLVRPDGYIAHRAAPDSMSIVPVLRQLFDPQRVDASFEALSPLPPGAATTARPIGRVSRL